MPNSFITLLDGKESLSRENVLTALGQVPFVQHQFGWLVNKIAQETNEEGRNVLMGYTGIKKLSPKREERMSVALLQIQQMSPGELSVLPATSR